MYCTLDKVDIVTNEDGREIAVQTDHRTPTEIGRSLDLSLIFALTRAWNPRRMGIEGVRVMFQHPAPEPLLEAMRTAGASVDVGVDPVPPATEPDPERMGRIADEALARLGQAFAKRQDLPLTREGIGQAETWAASLGLSPDETEIEYWTAVTELAAFCGEVFRATGVLGWALHPQADSVVPFLMRAQGGAFLNIFMRCERVFSEGPHRGPSSFFALPEGVHDGGPLMCKLKPADWVNASAVRCAPLLDLRDAEIPLLAYGQDLPSHFAYCTNTETRSLEELRAAAAPNLAKVRVEVDPLTAEILVVHGDYYAAEKLLDPAFMQTMHERLSAPMLLASAPVNGRLVVGDALAGKDSERALATMEAITRHMIEEDPPEHRICPTVFTVSRGVVVGVARGSQGAPDPAKKSWWRWIFG